METKQLYIAGTVSRLGQELSAHQNQVSTPTTANIISLYCCEFEGWPRLFS